MTERDPRQLELIDRYWRAANYVSVGQIYLMDIRCSGNRLKLNM